MVVSKYITPSNIIHWIRQNHRNSANISIIWKVVLNTKELIRNGLTWRIRSGAQVRLGVDPWVRCGNAHRLSEELRTYLIEQGITHVCHIVDNAHSTLLQQTWKSGLHLNIPSCWQQEWRYFTKALTEAHIRITEGDDELIWAFTKHGVYAPKIGYQVLMEPYKPPITDPWWKIMWKLKAAPRTRLLMWSIQCNKVRPLLI